MKKLLAVLTVLLLVSPVSAAEIGTVFGAGVGQEIGPTGPAFNIAFMGVRIKEWDSGPSFWTVASYGQYAAEHIDAFGGAAYLSFPWWTAEDQKGLVKSVSWLFEVGAFDKIREIEDGDRGIGLSVGGGIDFKLTESGLHAQITGKAFNTGPNQGLTRVVMLTMAASPTFIIGAGK